MACGATIIPISVMVNGRREVEFELELSDDARELADELVGSKVFLDLTTTKDNYLNNNVTELERVRESPRVLSKAPFLEEQ